MKIDLSIIDENQFNIKPGQINGLDCFLVTPKELGCEWNKNNLIFRSSIWDLNGNLLSAGFKKFWNESEKPELYPNPLDYHDWDCREKQDGSLLICDSYEGFTNFRTRGTHTYKTLENSAVIDILLKENKNLFNSWPFTTGRYSYLCEFYDPNRKIILDYGDKPKLWLLGIVDKNDYTYAAQNRLDDLAKEFNVARPKSFNFTNLENIQKSLIGLNDMEGYCLFYNNHQNIIKLKTNSYLVRHRFKSNATLDAVLDLFIELKPSTYEEFNNKIIEKFDWECFQLVLPLTVKVADAHTRAQLKINNIKAFINGLYGLSRKEQALKIIESSEPEFRAFYFSILDTKEILGQSMRKLMEVYLKNE